mgnify:CR=1 FL=1|tara:strand:- start:169 stop:921 length:753 start_codon:yes stop_codon:yes gene_type:complete
MNVATRSESEIKLISQSCQIVAETLELVSTYIKEGISVLELDRIAEEYILSRKAIPAFKGYHGFPATLCISIDDAVVHGIPDGTMLKDGQVVGVDCGAIWKGYYGDHARTFIVGDVSAEISTLINVTEMSLQKGIEQAIPGNYVGDIGFAIQNYAESFGFSVVRELVGHGIGTNLHEEPQIPNHGKKKSGYKLHAGMCIAIEPMINLGQKEIYTSEDGWTIYTEDGSISAHFEHTIAIKESGPVILSKVS